MPRSYQFLLPFTIATTYEFFKKTALYGGDYKEDVKQQPSSAEAVQSVANDKFAIGYFGLGYKTSGKTARKCCWRSRTWVERVRRPGGRSSTIWSSLA